MSGDYFDGLIDEAFFYKRILTPDEIDWLYNNGQGRSYAELDAGKRVSVDSNGNEGNNNSSSPTFSADGRYVAYSSAASNLVTNDTNGFFDVFVHDRQTGETSRVSIK